MEQVLNAVEIASSMESNGKDSLLGASLPAIIEALQCEVDYGWEQQSEDETKENKSAKERSRLEL